MSHAAPLPFSVRVARLLRRVSAAFPAPAPAPQVRPPAAQLNLEAQLHVPAGRTTGCDTLQYMLTSCACALGVLFVPLLLAQTRRFTDAQLLPICEVFPSLAGLIAAQWVPMALLAEWRFGARRTAHLLQVGVVLEAPTFTEVLLLSPADLARLQVCQGDTLILSHAGQTLHLSRRWTLRRWTRTDPVPWAVDEAHLSGRPR